MASPATTVRPRAARAALRPQHDPTDRLRAARDALRTGLDASRALASSLDDFSPRLDVIRRRLPSIEAAVRPIRAPRSALAAVGGRINSAVGPAAAVLKVFDAVHGLEDSLLVDPHDDLPTYLSLLRRLEEALRFLRDNCDLAIQWLEDIVNYLEENSIADDGYIAAFKSSLLSLRQSQSSLDGGLLSAALDRLEGEFRRLLSDNSVPLTMVNSTPTSSDQPESIAASLLPVPIIQKLLAVLQRLSANGRLEQCIRIYADVRGANVRAALRALELDYLDVSIADFPDVQSMEAHIVRWTEHMEFAVKHLLDSEYKLCQEVFERFGTQEAWMGCFAEIAAQAGMLKFLQFGRTVTESKKDPIKLLKLLDIFSCMNKLRLDFNRLFGGKACAEIQSHTRDLIKSVINGSAEIFQELLVQVEWQRQGLPPPDGAVPKLVSFIVDYCNRLLGDEYRPVLMQVLVINQSWKKMRFQERLLADTMLDIIRALEQNLDAWSKGHDVVLSYLFLMNTHWHFYKSLKGTKLGELLGEPWLQEQEQYMEYYAALYLKDSWRKLPPLLSREGLVLFSGGRATARDLVKSRLKEFNEHFDQMYNTHSNWAIPDKGLRDKMCQLVVQAIVPVYKSYMQNYGPLVEQDASANRYVKYTVESLEKMLGSLFVRKTGKSMSFRAARHSIGLSNGVMMASKYQSAPTAV